MSQESITKYRRRVQLHLERLTNILARTSIDDFSTRLQLPKKENEFTPIYVGIKILLESIGEKLFEFDQVNRILAENIVELEQSNIKIQHEKVIDDAILQSVGDGLIVINEKAVVLMMNYQAEKILGYDARDIVGKNWSRTIRVFGENAEVLAPRDWPISKSLRTGRKVTGQYNYARQDGSLVPVGLTATPVFLDNHTIGAVGVFRDITKERAIDEAKTEVVSFTSHQLRTPLSVLNWYTEKLLDQDFGPLNQKQVDYLQAMQSTVAKTIGLVNTFLNVSRLQLGTLPVNNKQFDVAEVFEDVIYEIVPQIRQKSLRLTRRVDATNQKVWGDSKLIRIVFQNLIGNAVKYTPEGGRISYRIRPTETDELPVKGLVIEVTDTGYGIPKKQQAEVFSKLFRADNAKEIDTEGAGLGLYMVKLISRYVGGDVWFKSTLNKGTTFFVAIPLRNPVRNKPVAKRSKKV